MYSLDRIPVCSVPRATLRIFNPKKPKKPKNLIFFIKNLRFLPALVSTALPFLHVFLLSLPFPPPASSHPIPPCPPPPSFPNFLSEIAQFLLSIHITVIEQQ